jgi:transcriptional regulator with XRE-family HTH domain
MKATDDKILTTMVSIRHRHGLTQAQVAQRVGYHVNTIGRWETGDVGVPLHAWLDWCEALKTTPAVVLAAARRRR